MDGKQRTLLVHRKGSTRAFPPHHPLIPVDSLFVYTSPAVDHNGVIASPPLHLGHLLNDVSDSLQVWAPPIRAPVDDVELHHLVGFPWLKEENVKLKDMYNLGHAQP